MGRRQQHQQRRRLHARQNDQSSTSAAAETTTSDTPTTTPKSSSPVHSTRPTPTTPAASTTKSSSPPSHTTSSSSAPSSDTSTSSPLTSLSISSTTSETSSSPSVSSTTSTTSSTSVEKPTTMSGTTTTTSNADPVQSTPSLTNPSMGPKETINGNNGGPSKNVATKSISGGTIAAIIFGCIAGTAALLILFCFIRRKLRPKRRRHHWHTRAPFTNDRATFPEDAPPVIGTRNALALARANMGHNTDVHEPEMTQMPQPTVPVLNHWGAYGDNTQDPYAHQDQYQYQQPAQPHFHLQDPRDVQQHGGYNYQGHQEPQNEKYMELARQLEIPAVPLSPHPSSHTEGQNSPPAPDHTLSTSAYGSLSAHEPSPSHPTRSGTPVDANPQQAYLAPNLETGHSADVGSRYSRSSVYDNGGAYGGM